MGSKFCPYCGCLILESGYCRNKQCILGEKIRGKKQLATYNQIQMLKSLCKELNEEQLETEIEEYGWYKLTKEEASKHIQALINKRDGLEDWE